MPRLYLLLVISSALSLCACDGSSGPQEPTDELIARATVGPSGGDVASDDQRFLLQVPAGALTAGTDIQVYQVADPSSFSAGISQLAFPGRLTGPLFFIKSDIDTLSLPARLTLPYDPHLVSQSGAISDILVMRRGASGHFEIVSGGVDVESQVTQIDTLAATVSVEISRFSSMAAVVVPPGLPPRVENVGCSTGSPTLAGIYDLQGDLGLRRRGATTSAIVIHSTMSGTQTIFQVMAYGVNGEQPNQGHYYIDTQGAIYRLVAEDYRARHVGQVLPSPTPQYNDIAVGIELQQRAREGPPLKLLPGWPFTPAQYASVRELLRGLFERYPTITYAENPGQAILYHKDIQPSAGPPGCSGSSCDWQKKYDPYEFDISQVANVTPCSSAALPDLTIAATVAGTYAPGQTGVQIPVTVTRTGGELTTGVYVTAGLYWSADPTLDASDQPLWASNNGATPDFPNSTLNTQGSKTVSATVNLPVGAAGTFFLLAVVDPSHFYLESNENNNLTPYAVTTSSGIPAPLTASSVWRGTGTQVSPTGSWSVLLSYVGGTTGSVVGAIAYPSLSCGGTLTLENITTNATVFTEHITYGSCIDGSDVTAWLTGPTSLTVEWHSVQSPGTTGTAALARVDDGGTAVPSSYSGVWEGSAYQYDVPGSWSALLAIANGTVGSTIGSSAYPSLKCGGELALATATPAQIDLAQTITYGGTVCVANAVMNLTLGPAASLVSQWRLTPTGPVVAIGALQRAGGQLPPVPAPPANLRATSASETLLNLTWADNSNNESGFTIGRSVGGGPTMPVAVVGPDVVSFQDGGLSPGGEYTYTLRAFNPGGVSAASNAAAPSGRLFAASIGGTLLGSLPPSDLYTVGTSPIGTDRLIGRVRTAAGFQPAITDLAPAPDGQLWAVSFERLYTIDILSATATDKGALGISDVNALAADTRGNLFGATLSGSLVSIDPASGAARTIGPLGNGLVSWGDLAFAPDGRLFAALHSGGQGVLATIDISTGQASLVNPGTPIGNGNVWGLAFVGDRLFGLTTDAIGRGSLLDIDPISGLGTFIRALGFNAGGAGAVRQEEAGH